MVGLQASDSSEAGGRYVAAAGTRSLTWLTGVPVARQKLIPEPRRLVEKYPIEEGSPPTHMVMLSWLLHQEELSVHAAAASSPDATHVPQVIGHASSDVTPASSAYFSLQYLPESAMT